MINVNVFNVEEKEKLQQCYSLHQLSQPNPWNLDTFSDMVSDPYRLFYGVTSSNEIVGYAIGLEVVGEVTLMDIAVAKNYRNKKVGSHLLMFFVNHYQVKGVSNIVLEVRELNLAAINLYHKFNFEQIALRENYYPGIEDPQKRENAILMSLNIQK